MRFEVAFQSWIQSGPTQAESALLAVRERSCRPYVVRFQADGLKGLIDRRLEQVSNPRALVDEVIALTERFLGHRSARMRQCAPTYAPMAKLACKNVSPIGVENIYSNHGAC